MNGRDFDTEMILPIMEDEKNTVLVLAGDICLAKNVPTLFFKDLSQRFRYIIYIAGNHESYRGNIKLTSQLIREQLREFPNVAFLDNENIIIDDVIFCGATLWTDFNKSDRDAMDYAKHAMSDYQIIGYGPVDAPVNVLPPWTPRLSVAYHEESLAFIEETLQFKGKYKTVIVTHHLPSGKLSDPKFAGSMLNSAFYSNLDDFIIKYKPDVWACGHTHHSVDTVIGSTRMIINPKGYGLHPSENLDYNPCLVIEV